MSSNSPGSPGYTKRTWPESFRARKLAASLTVADLQKSVQWYTDVVGFFVEQKIERDGKLRAVAILAGDVRLMLNQDDGAKGWTRTKGEGFSLTFTTGQSVDDVARRIKERGGKLELEPKDMPWGARIIRVLDPDGFKLTISMDR